VMTPRPATEAVVEAAVATLGDRAARVADVGTGSGAIAAALASRLPHVTIEATDSSRAAVALARANIERLGLAQRVTVRHCDLLDGVAGQLDVVVANLPYLSSEEASRFPDLASEPTRALFAAGDGLEPYRRLLGSCRERLTADGAVVIQLHRRALVARRDELAEFTAELPKWVPTPALAAA